MRAVLSGYYGFGNGGDEALLATLLQMLPGHVEPVVLAANPQAASRRYGVPCCDRWNLGEVVRAIAGADAFVWGGGSLLQDVSGPASVLYYGGLMTLAQALGKRTIAWAQGIGPLERTWTRSIARRVLAGCTAVSVRDRGSAELLDVWGIPFEATCDPVWALEPTACSVGSDLPAPRTAVILRPHPELTEERIRVLIGALAQLQRATGGSVLCVPFQPSTDTALASRVCAGLSGPNLLVAIDQPDKLLGLLGTVEFTVAMRLHGVLMAAAAGSAVWGLIYDPKVAYLLDQIDAPGCTLSELPTDPAKLSACWLDQYANGFPLSDIQRSSWMERARINRAVLDRTLVA